jgi:c-di-GMP-binding flagellar brake protein YcgR
MDPIESRRTKRKDITLTGNFKIKDALKYKLHIYKEPLDMLLSDVGVMGCGFVTAYYLPKGLIVSIKIRDFPVISGKDPIQTRDIEFTAKVMSCKTTPTRVNRVGAEFVEIRNESRDIIKRYIAEG